MAQLTFVRRLDIKDKAAGLTEPSGLALARPGRGYWTVSDDTRRILRLNADGQVRSDKSFASPRKQLEGIAADASGDTLYACRETPARILKFDVPSQTVTVSRKLSKMQHYAETLKQAFDAAPEKGLEGITTRASDGHILALKESKPGILIEISPCLTRIVATTELTPQQGFRARDPDGAVDFSGIAWDQTRDAAWIVSDRARRIYLFDLHSNSVRDTVDLTYPVNGGHKRVKKPEGIAHDPVTDCLHIVSDRKARLYIFKIG
jgi:uncharacterized protein YjiK